MVSICSEGIKNLTDFGVIMQMLHVWDHFDYTNDVAWFRAQGWPLLKVTVLQFSPSSLPSVLLSAII